MSTQREWSAGRLAILTLLLLELAALMIWAVINFERYRTLSLVAAALWSASLTVVGYFKVRAPSESSFAELLGHPPVRLTVVVVFLLTLGGGLGMAPRYMAKDVAITIEPSDVANVEIRIITAARDTQRWSIPAGPLSLRLPSGTHELIVAAPGFDTSITPLAVLDYRMFRPHQHTVKLREQLGTLLLVAAAGQDARVDIRRVQPDSVVAQNAPVGAARTFAVPAGRYLVTATAANHQPDSALVDVVRGDTAQWQVSLARTLTPHVNTPTHGTISFQIAQPGAEVFIEGLGSIGVTPVSQRRLRAGSYNIVIRRLRPDIDVRAADQLVRTVTVVAGRTITVSGSFQAVSLVRLTLGASPSSAGDYVALDLTTGVRRRLGRADAEQAAWLFPGPYRLERHTDGRTVEGPTVQLISNARSQPGF